MGAQDTPNAWVTRTMDLFGFSTLLVEETAFLYLHEMSETATFSRSLQTPLGHLRIVCSSINLLAIHFDQVAEPGTRSNALCEQVVAQLQDYFNGESETFDLPLAPEGTEFQQKVWQALLELPFGKTTSYLALAHKLGDEKVIRAAANANGKNPIPIIIPCHRVIGSDGSLTGYAGGLENKRWLLQHEGALQPELF